MHNMTGEMFGSRVGHCAWCQCKQFVEDGAAPCPFHDCRAARTLKEVQEAECYTCGRDTWEDVPESQVPPWFQGMLPQ